jgi:plasmid stability protein
MSSITIRNLDESVKTGLRLRAARHGCSMEQEVRQILQQTVAPEQTEEFSFAERINRRFAGIHIDSLPYPTRKPSRKPPEFESP